MDQLCLTCFNNGRDAVSFGPFNQMLTLMSTVLMTSQCWLKSSEKWPLDHGPQLIKNGNEFKFVF